MEKRSVITVDGLAGSGKSALSRELARKLSFVHFSSGLLYRAIGWLALKEGVDPHDGPAVAALTERHSVLLTTGTDSGSCLLIDAVEHNSELQQPEVSQATSIASAQPELRSALIALQREAYPGCGLVAEGRDMGTVIFPDAQVKFFVEASLEVRVARRIEQLYGGGAASAPEKVNSLKTEMEKEVIERDLRDSGRSIAPAVPAVDAILIDNSAKTLTQVVHYMYDAVANRGLLCNSD